ncbi:aspartate carbamoyltransferase regulatory subunit [Candidatus Borrarchaeum sp.]|uniref:aspartate carbamoyltransferase regulatory subunit n=1 Tax=Candidatus Borrarchaeum sp. TaxID=2846742 RepID=UPI0031832C2A
MEDELRVRKIRNGTVIDHIRAGNALTVLKILGISGGEGNTISIAINVPSGKAGRKDIVKIEDRELEPQEVDIIALIAPNATINIIRDFKVVEKNRVKLPTTVKGYPRCINPNCVTAAIPKEPVEPHFILRSKEPLRIRCHYCHTVMDKDDIIKNL